MIGTYVMKELTWYMEFKLMDQNNLSSSHIAGFFGHPYLWMESVNVLDFFHRDSHQ